MYQFLRFYENLQIEVLQLEFNEFSRGKPTISEMDFAKILLRYTVVHSDDYQAYLQRVEERIPEMKVSFNIKSCWLSGSELIRL